VVNIPRASRKDVRDAVAAARKAAVPWAARTAYNRGQILYRAAEALESSADRFAGRVGRAEVDAALAEVLGVSDVPAGVVNLLSGRRGELATALGAHRDLNAIVDAAGDAELAAGLDRLAAETIKRVRHGTGATSYEGAVADALERIEAVTELKTAWHPVGA
jgi:acyl-CoA reductase-like NAD-dependent aldehyde dehydrogenase